MSIQTICRASLAAALTAGAVPAWSQSYHHAPPTGAGGGSLLPVLNPSAMSLGESAWTPTSSWTPSSWSSPGMMSSPAMMSPPWSPETTWASSSLNVASLPSPPGVTPLPSRMHSSAFVTKHPTYVSPELQQLAKRTPAPPPSTPPQVLVNPRLQPTYGPTPQPMAAHAMPPAAPVMQTAAAAPLQTIQQRQPQPMPQQPLPAPAPEPMSPTAMQPTAMPQPVAQHVAMPQQQMPQQAMTQQAMTQQAMPQQVMQQQPVVQQAAMPPADAGQARLMMEQALANGDWPGAIQACGLLIQLEPSQPGWRVRRAECYYFSGQYDLAVADYRTAAVSMRLSFDEFVRFGDAALRIGDHATAERVMASLKRSSKEPLPQIELLRGLATLRQGKRREARNILLRASARWPDDAALTEALAIASAAHYGNRPLPNIEERRLAQRQEPSVPPRAPELLPAHREPAASPPPAIESAAVTNPAVVNSHATSEDVFADESVFDDAPVSTTHDVPAAMETPPKGWKAAKPAPQAVKSVITETSATIVIEPPGDETPATEPAPAALPSADDDFADVRADTAATPSKSGWRAAR